MQSFFQGLITNWVSELAMLIGGLVFAFLKRYKTSWAPVVAYGLGASTCIAVLVFTFTGHAIFSPPLTNSSNIENNLKKWTASFGYGVEAIAPPSENMDFDYRITAPTIAPLTIYRDVRNRPAYLQLQVVLTIAPQHKAILEKLTTAQAIGIVEVTQNVILSRKMSYIFAGKDPNSIHDIVIIKAVVINGLTESEFGEAIDDVESTMALTRNQFLLAIQPYAKSTTLHQEP